MPMLINSGQSCNAPSRMLVPARLYDEAVRIAKSVAERCVVGIYGDCDGFGPPARHNAQTPGFGGRDVARALRKEDEADMTGAAGQRRFKRFLGLQPADFYVEWHDCGLARDRARVEEKG